MNTATTTETTTLTPYDQQAQAFLDRHGLKIRVTRRSDGCPGWASDTMRPADKCGCSKCGAIHGDRYRVTIYAQARGRLAFDFWGSYADMKAGKDPAAYNVLACISGDLYTPETFADFCGEYGYDGDSRKAFLLFKRCDRFARRLRAFFKDEDERAELAEIQ